MNIIEWINNNLHKNNRTDKLKENDIQNILAFTMLWNLYEDLFWTRNSDNTNHSAYSLGEALKTIKNKKDKLSEDIINPIFCYFYHRYQDEVKFNQLKFRDKGADNEARKKLENMINSSIEHSKSDKLEFIMAIVFRYRNNLFHGEKQLIKIKYQEENFEYANKFLMHIIEKCKEDL